MRSILSNRMFQMGAAALVVVGLGYTYFDYSNSAQDETATSETVSNNEAQEETETTEVLNTDAIEATETTTTKVLNSSE